MCCGAEKDEDGKDYQMCCGKDEEGALCATVMCKRQCGTNGCCQEDKDQNCCACVLFYCQCNLGMLGSCLGTFVSGALCCAGQAAAEVGVATAGAAGAGAAMALPGLFGCLSDCGTCLKLTFPLTAAYYMPIQYARNAARIDGDSTPFCVDCSSYACMMPCLSCCCIAGTKRTVLKRSVGLEDSPCSDKLTHLFCPCCALIQEKRWLDQHKCTHGHPAVELRKGVTGEAMDRSMEGNAL